MGELFEYSDGSFLDALPKSKRKSKNKDTEVELPQEVITVDIATLTPDQLKHNLRNQIYNQAMNPSPQPSTLALAVKVFGLVDAQSATNNELDELSTEEIINRINKLTGVK